MNSQIADFTVSLVGLGLVAVLWFQFWRPYTVARLRHDLFVLRDELFDQAFLGQNGLSFDSPFYKRLRDDLNGLLRYCHKASLVHAVLQLWLENRFGVKRVFVPTMRLNAEQLRTLTNVKTRQRAAMVRYLLQSSPIIWLILLVYILGSLRVLVSALARCQWHTFNQRLRSVIARLAANRLEHAAGQKILTEDEDLGGLCPA